MNARPFVPRGFTLIETMMAAALGAILVLACVAMMGAMNRTESASARRFDETASLARVHLIMNRVWSDLLIQGVDAGGASATANATRATAGSSTGDYVSPDAVRNGQAQADPRPRVLLELDPNPQVRAAMKAAGLDSSGAPPQRLELVTNKAPIPANFSNASTVELQQAMDDAGTIAARGVFELRPDAATPRERMNPEETLAGDGKGWTLWWRPLPPTEGMLTPDPYSLDPTQDPNSVRVAAGLMQCNWQVFQTVKDPATGKSKGREKVPTMSAMQLQDLPAYVEMRATTASGLSANWMFEVGWSFGPETQDEADQNGAGAGAAGGNATGGNGAGGNGATVRGNGGPAGGPPGAPGAGPAGRNGRPGPGRAGAPGTGFKTIIGPGGRTTTIGPDGKTTSLDSRPGGRGGG